MSESGNSGNVVIAGGGPVGMALAIELAQRGIPSTVVERYASLQEIPKGQNLNQRTMELFHFWGAEERLRGARTIPASYGIGGLTAYGSLLSGYHYDWLRRELVQDFYFRKPERLPQQETERVLRARAAELNLIDIHYGWRVDRVSQDESGAWVEAENTETCKTRRFAGSYVVGCDGAHSTVRSQAGITQTRNDHDKLMVLLVFRSTGLHTLLERFPGKSFYCVLHPDLKGYWRFFGRVDLGSSWFFHAPVPPGTTKENFNFEALLHEAVGAPFDVEFDHIGFWDLRIATADDYRNGRVFVAGDAAHSHPPYGGYGINTGFEDARNLGWKLAANLKGWGGKSLLESYSAERQPVFASTARDFIERFIQDDRRFLEAWNPDRDRDEFEKHWAERSGITSEVSSYVPNYAGSPIVFGPSGARSGATGEHRVQARPGFHLTPCVLSSGRNVYEALGHGFSLIALGADPQTVDAFRKAAAERSIPLDVIEDAGSKNAEAYGVRLVLVRPDQFVAWTGGDEAVDPDAVLARASGS